MSTIAAVVSVAIIVAAGLLALSCVAFLVYLRYLDVAAKTRKLYRPDTYRSP